jgi:hypothetical protein
MPVHTLLHTRLPLMLSLDHHHLNGKNQGNNLYFYIISHFVLCALSIAYCALYNHLLSLCPGKKTRNKPTAGIEPQLCLAFEYKRPTTHPFWRCLFLQVQPFKRNGKPTSIRVQNSTSLLFTHLTT